MGSYYLQMEEKTGKSERRNEIGEKMGRGGKRDGGEMECKKRVKRKGEKVERWVVDICRKGREGREKGN